MKSTPFKTAGFKKAGLVLLAALSLFGIAQTEERPSELTTLFAKGRQSSGYGLGLGIVQRLCQQTGLELQLSHTDQQLTVRLLWP